MQRTRNDRALEDKQAILNQRLSATAAADARCIDMSESHELSESLSVTCSIASGILEYTQAILNQRPSASAAAAARCIEMSEMLYFRRAHSLKQC